MYDVIKVLAAFGVFIGICAICEWLADNAPWIVWVMLPIIIWVIFTATFGNYFKEEK